MPGKINNKVLFGNTNNISNIVLSNNINQSTIKLSPMAKQKKRANNSPAKLRKDINSLRKSLGSITSTSTDLSWFFLPIPKHN